MSPCLAYSYCYRDMNTGHRICSQYSGVYNPYNNLYRRYPHRYYNTAPVGATTVVKYNAGFPVSVQRGWRTYSINSLNNGLQNSGATFVFK